MDIGEFYTPQPKQQGFQNSPAGYPLPEGGRGGGKTTAIDRVGRRYQFFIWKKD